MQIDNFCVGLALYQVIANCMHKVGLAQTYTTVNEQRVVSTTWILGNLHGRGSRKLIRFPFNEIVEGVFWIQTALVPEFAINNYLHVSGSPANQRSLGNRRAWHRDNHGTFTPFAL